jgi:uncharacterized protein (DUF2062 family)
MFRSRARPSVPILLKRFVWPRTGWRRASEYLLHRVQRLPGTPYSVAAGLACGAAMSMTPFIGAHFFLAAVLAWLIRANVIASTFGTIIGNPWTFPLIWIGSFRLGQWMLGEDSSIPGNEGGFSGMFSALIRSMIEADGHLFATQVWPVWLPMILGSIPLAIVTGLIVYATFYRPIELYQMRRLAKRLAKQHRELRKERQS